MKTNVRTLAAALLIAFAPLAGAQATGATAPGKNTGQALVASKIASNFTHLAGGKENSLALVNALRTGGEVSLVTAVPPPAGSPPGTLPTTTTTTFTPPTKPMGWGNVRHSLALAQDQLTRAGITNPTAEQLQTALMGGDLVVTNANGTTTTTPVKGILTLRADGMGWGNIAKEGGTKLGPVTSKVDMSAKGVKSTTPPSTGVTTAAAGSSIPTAKSKGITTASGVTATHGSKGLVTAGGASAGANPSGKAYGRGIVTGGGGGSTNLAATGHGKGHTNGGGAGLVSGGGNAKGQGNGKGKGG